MPATEGGGSMRWLMALLLALLVAMARAAPIRVYLEPLPPLVNADGTGLTVDMLHGVEKTIGRTFDIHIVSYARAKYQLRNGHADLIGHTPVGKETPEFYRYARELDWQVITKADLFSLDTNKVNGDQWRKDLIGTPLGNAAFLARMSGLPVANFVQSSLPNLVQMLARGHIPVLFFERASTMTTLVRMGVKGVHYRNLYTVPAGLAVARTPAGLALKKRLDAALETEPMPPSFVRYRRIINLPDQGMVTSQGLAGR